MFDRTDSLLYSQGLEHKTLKLMVVGTELESVLELEKLLETLGVRVVGRMISPLKRIVSSTYYGSGKVEAIRAQKEESGADGVAFDVELSPNQLRNLEKILGGFILDRAGVIIEIFSVHAQTKESKTQVALARMQYLLPRLTHFWNHFERQRGGGTGSRGMGEKQLEVDRRLVKQRITTLKRRLDEIEKDRALHRGGRKEVLKAALVGYTNVGKSTLLNALTQATTRAEDKLFATLDASVRMLDPKCHPPIVLIDTVGFIDRLPPALVASFRSTLEELREAELLIHVVDVSHPRAQEQIQVTESILRDLGLGDRARITILNKWDLLKDVGAKNQARILAPGAVNCSASNPGDIKIVREKILNFFLHQLETYEVVIPYEEARVEGLIYEHGSVELSRHLDRGTFLRFRMDRRWAAQLQLERFGVLETQLKKSALESG